MNRIDGIENSGLHPFSCHFSDGVECKNRNCYKCGWNPDVLERRKKAFRRKLQENENRRRASDLLEVDP